MTADKKLARNTTALDESGRMVTFPAGTTVSPAVAKGITNPKAWLADDEPADEPVDDESAAPSEK